MIALSAKLAFCPAITQGEQSTADLKFGSHEFSSRSDDLDWLVGVSSPGTHVRLDCGNVYPLGPERLSLNITDFTFAYYNDGRGPHWGVNIASMAIATMLAAYDPYYPSKEGYFRYRWLGPFSSLPLLPQMLTNWSLRYDLIGRHAGIWAGPVTDYLAGKSDLIVASYLHAGIYLPVWKMDLVGSVARDPFRHQNRAYVRIGKVLR